MNTIRIRLLYNPNHLVWLILIFYEAIMKAKQFISIFAISTAICYSGCGTTSAPIIMDANAPQYNGSAIPQVNGQAPIGKMNLHNNIIYKHIDANSVTHIVMKYTLAPGERSSVGFLEYEATVCVAKGQVTVYEDGKQPKVINESNCTGFPADIKGYIQNNSSDDNVTSFIHFTFPKYTKHEIVNLEKKQ